LSQRTQRELSPGYTGEVDRVDGQTWYELLRCFNDASIYQTLAYGLVRNGRTNLSHLVVKEHGEVVAIAQSRIVRAPVIGGGIAYVMWGPLWRSRSGQVDATVFRQVIRALRNEYVVKRGLLLRLYPVLFEEEHSWLLPVLQEEGFSKAEGTNQARTILMDLSPALSELQKGLRPHWQRELKVAGKQKLDVSEGVGDELFDQFVGMYKEMVARKKFREPNDIHEFQEIQRRLPPEFKMKLMLCSSMEGLCAGVICSAIGGTALYLFGATSLVGMKSRGSYLLQWKLIEQLKDVNVSQYDLNGINPDVNPGTYKFKSDLGGDKGREVRFLGQFESCENTISWACVRMGEKVRAMAKGLTPWR
jgi:lipid II:glycine glycyltransferase (peptidoglycan interpeptide bridge formation enzyme)